MNRKMEWIDLENGPNNLKHNQDVLLWDKDGGAYLANVYNAKEKLFADSYTGEFLKSSEFSHYAIIESPNDPA
jgi:hypothetical protein